MNWIDVSEKLPKKGEYVLIKTEYCKYPYCIGFYNGVNWICTDDKTNILNVNYWCYLQIFESENTKNDLIEWVYTMYLQNLSGRENFDESFKYGIESTINELIELQIIKF